MTYALDLSSPWMNASGTLGFLPSREWPFASPAGAFVTDPLSLKPRRPAEERCLLPYPGGFLLHTGWPNPGLRAVLRQAVQRWQRSRLPVWVHLLAESPAELAQLVSALEGREGVTALEIGLPPQCSPQQALELVRAAQGELPLAVCLPVSAAGQSWLADLPGAGASALVLSGPRGTLTSKGKLVSGRLYGPGLFPQVLNAVRELCGLPIPVIAGAGVFSVQDGQTLLDAGGAAVQVDGALWR